MKIASGPMTLQRCDRWLEQRSLRKDQRPWSDPRGIVLGLFPLLWVSAVLGGAGPSAANAARLNLTTSSTDPNNTKAPPVVASAPMPESSADQDLHRPFASAIDSALPRTVKLYGLGAGAQAGYGSGILVSSEGAVLTVLSLLVDSRNLRAITADGVKHEAEVLARDKGRQLALIQLKYDKANPRRFPWFNLQTGRPQSAEEIGGDSPAWEAAALQPGDWLITAGNAFKVAEGSESVSINHGVFSIRTRLDARRRVQEFPYRGDVLVYDAVTSNPGSPGGAVVDITGRLQGMIGRDVISNLTHTHFNYAAPRDVLQAFYQEATAPRTDGAIEPSKPAAAPSAAEVDYGIRLTRAGYRTVLPFVERIRAGSPAARAGLAPDDLILSVNGKNVTDVDNYQQRLRELETGAPLDLVIRRGRAILSIRVEPPL